MMIWEDIGNGDIKHIIWDYNGTLLNDVDICVEVINLILSRRNLPEINKDQYKEQFGFPVRDYYERIGFDFVKESFEIVGTEFIDEYNAKMKNLELHLYTEEVIKLIASRDIPQSVLSARLTDSLTKELDHFKLTHYFQNIYGLDNHYAKGKEDIGKKLIENIDIPAENILFIGDTLHDFEVAHNLGCKHLLIANGHHSLHRLERVSDQLLGSMSEFLKILSDK